MPGSEELSLLTCGEGQTDSADGTSQASRDATVANEQGFHARPVMAFVDLAQEYEAYVSVANLSKRREEVDGKSAMQMMLLEATQGSVLRITAKGVDAAEAVTALAALVEAGFKTDSPPQSDG